MLVSVIDTALLLTVQLSFAPRVWFIIKEKAWGKDIFGQEKADMNG